MMRPHPWRSLYYSLAAAGLVVCLVFSTVISAVHLGVVAGLIIAAPLGLAWLGGRLDEEFEPPPVSSKKPMRRAAGYATVLWGISAAKFFVLGWIASEFMPSLHDELSYLFGAETFALGRLSNPTPPHAEFFDAFHVLVEPCWVTRYPPGHPAALAFGVLLGWPALVVIGLNAGTVVWVYALGRELGGETTGRVAGALALFAPGMDYLSSGFLSQSTFLFSITGCYVSAIRSVHRPNKLRLISAGALGGWAILTRPYTAAAVGLPLAIWFVWRILGRGQARALNVQAGGVKPEEPAADSRTTEPVGIVEREPGAFKLLLATLPLIASLALLAAYNTLTVGSPWRTAWEEYNRQFEPDNTLGFAGKTSQAIPEGLSERKLARAQSIAGEKERFTWSAALHRALANPGRLSSMVYPAVGFYGLIAFIPHGFVVRNVSNESRQISLLLLACLAMHYVAYSFFYSDWGIYGYETIPFVLVLVATGLLRFWRSAGNSNRPGITAAVPLVLLAALISDFRDTVRSVGKRREETEYHRAFARKLSEIHDESAIVFVRLDPRRPHVYDLIYNSPDLSARVLVVLDLGDRNADLIQDFPERRLYVFDEANRTVSLWERPRSDMSAK